MKRRDFIKTGLCMGCAGFLSDCLSLGQDFSSLSLDKFMYKDISELPTRVRLDACNICQLNCVKCWIRENEELVRENLGFGYLKFEDFKNFVDKHPFLKEIELSANGEIFLNPEINEIIKYAYEKGIVLEAGSGVNLNTLSEKTAEYLVKYKFKFLDVSIDGASPKTYAIYRRGGDFNQVIANVKMINKYKKLYNSEYPFMAYKFILFGHNQHEIDAAKKLAKELNMTIIFAENGYPDYSPLKHKKTVLKKLGMYHEAKEDKEIPLITFEKDEKNVQGICCFPCNDLFAEPQINWDGTLLGCRLIYRTTLESNVFNVGLLNALNSFKITYMRAMLSDFSIPDRKDIICSWCCYYMNQKKLQQPFNFKKNNV